VGGDLRIQGATTKGSLLVGDGTSTAEFAVPAPPPPNGSVLILDDTQPLGVRWGGESGPIATITAGNNIDILGTSANPIVAFQTPTTANIRLGVGTELEAKDNYITPTYTMSIDSTGLNDKYDVGGVVNQEDIAVSSTNVIQTLSTTNGTTYQNISVLTCNTTGISDIKTATNLSSTNYGSSTISCLPNSAVIGVGCVIPSSPANIDASISIQTDTTDPQLTLSQSAPFSASYSTIINKNGITQNNSGGVGFTINTNSSACNLQNTSTIGLFAGSSIAIVSPTSTTITGPLVKCVNNSAGGQANPQLVLENTNATGSVALEVYKNKPTAGSNGDVLFNQSVYGKDSGNAKQEFTRITHTIRDNTGGTEDGSIEMSCFVNGSINTFLQLNGVENEVNCLKALDMGGNNIITNTGDLRISTTNSSGTGIITLAPNTTGYVNIPSETDPTNDFILINPQTSGNSQRLLMTATDTPSGFKNSIDLLNLQFNPLLELKAEFGVASRSISLHANGVGATNVLTAFDTQANAPFQIDTSGYTNGSIDFKVNDTTGDIIFTGTNIQSGTSGGNSGQHLRIKLNGTYYKIRLEDD
jgi:hypothetical protein